MENKQKEMGYIEGVMEHVSRTNHRRGIHIWLDEAEDGEGISLSMSHNFNGSDGTEQDERVIQIMLEIVLKSVKLRTMGSEHPEIAEFMRFMESLEAGEGDE